MKTNQTTSHGWALKVLLRLLKYYGYFLIGLTATCVLSVILGFFPIVFEVLFYTGSFLLRLLGVLIALVMTSAVFESLRY